MHRSRAIYGEMTFQQRVNQDCVCIGAQSKFQVSYQAVHIAGRYSLSPLFRNETVDTRIGPQTRVDVLGAWLRTQALFTKTHRVGICG